MSSTAEAVMTPKLTPKQVQGLIGVLRTIAGSQSMTAEEIRSFARGALESLPQTSKWARADLG